MEFALRVADQLCVGAALQDNATADVTYLVKVLQKVYAVRNNDPGLGGEQSIGANDVFYGAR